MKNILPKYILKFLLKIGVFLVVFTLCRLTFLIFNNSHFPVVYFTDFLAGIWFDLVTTAIIFLPILLIEIFPNKWRHNKWYQRFLGLVFFVFLFIAVLTNLADIEYFKFTGSRTTASTLTMLSYGNDLNQQLPSFFKDYWYIFIFQILFMLVGWFLYRRINRIEDDSKTTSWLKQIILFPFMAALLVLIGRGTGLRPIEPINVTGFTIDQNVPMVLNSTFTIIKSWGKTNLKEKHFFEDDSIKEWFDPIKKYGETTTLEKPNIVILMLESFSVEYIAAINGKKEVYTPFLDSLIGESMVYTNCYANGKKSIDAVPSVVASVPKLMEQEFITSTYSTNKIESLPKHLHNLNYETAFFHGATNGSMNFDQFAKKVDFDHYFGRFEYNNDKDYDGTWGIFDEEFFKWSAQQMTEMEQPFMGTIFSLSSHPPYTIPEKYNGKFTGGPTEMHNSVKYTDFAIGEFFKFAKTQPWYNNTLFIITADHTPASGDPDYFSDMGNMHIPLIIYHPFDSTFKGRSDKIVAQVDIMPTILDLIGYNRPFYSFGQSIFRDFEGISVSYNANKYLIYGKNHLLTFQNDKPLGMYNLSDRTQSLNVHGKETEIAAYLEQKIKAYIQIYHRDLIHNTMVAE